MKTSYIGLLIVAFGIWAVMGYCTIGIHCFQDILISAILIIIALYLAYRNAYVPNFSIIWDVMVFCLFYVKYIFVSYTAASEVMIDFSLLWNLGQASLFLASILIGQNKLPTTRFYFYANFVVVCSSHCQNTVLFLCGLFVYMLVYTACSRSTIAYPMRYFYFSKKPQIFLLVLSFCNAVFAVFLLTYYREEINNWRPFVEIAPTTKSGFSVYSDLHSIHIEFSNKPVLRYFAPPGRYYLRGKVFEKYENGRWQLSTEKINTQNVENNVHNDSYVHPDHVILHRLWRLETVYSVIFSPLEWEKIDLPSIYGPIYSNQENIVWGSPQLPYLVPIQVRQNPLPISQELSANDYLRYCHIPPNLQEFLKSFSAQIPITKQSDKKIIADIIAYLHQNYTYETTVKLDTSQDPVQSFLSQKTGAHCELFATSLALLCRNFGIPCRYVVGYHAQEWNTLGKFLTVREKDAHAWVEVYLQQDGWVTVEATPNVIQADTLHAWDQIFDALSYGVVVAYQAVYMLWNEYKLLIVVVLVLLYIFRRIMLHNYMAAPICRRYEPKKIVLPASLQKAWNEYAEILGERPIYVTRREWLYSNMEKIPIEEQQKAIDVLEKIEEYSYSHNIT